MALEEHGGLCTEALRFGRNGLMLLTIRVDMVGCGAEGRGWVARGLTSLVPIW
jgi:hypothetical protein